ncbi:phosphatase PAP2 family protein [Kitasatospora sp. NPDC101801]|uniref:phosphatase PAP2 family protein n=1 Tax=Kitasatospora sp. NPDC101801 TaxID=3364103 RepID=UPI00381C5BF6
MTRRAVLIGVPLLLFALLSTVLVLHGRGPYPVESELHSWLLTHRPAWAVRTVGLVTDLGTGAPPYLAAVAAGLRWAHCAGRSVVRVCAPVLALAVGQVIRTGLMLAVGRSRPPVADWATSASGYSYPSGHTFTAAVAAGLLAWALLRVARRPWVTPAVVALGAAGVAVGLSRVYLGVHWAFDVLGGWLLAALWLALVLPLLARLDLAAGAPGVTELQSRSSGLR